MRKLELIKLVAPLRPLLAFSEHLWLDYDREADVLYLSFRKPQQANDSELEDNVVYHYRDGELVGVTIIGFQEHLPENVAAQ